MNTLNLIRLNLQSPYEVWTESNDTYFFETDYGVKYMIFFGDDAPIWKSGAYTFDIQNTNQKTSPNDPKVFWRSFAYFVYRYFLRGGFLDGKAGFIFTFIQGWWYRTLVDVNILEVQKWLKANNQDIDSHESRQALKQYIKDKWGITTN